MTEDLKAAFPEKRFPAFSQPNVWTAKQPEFLLLRRKLSKLRETWVEGIYERLFPMKERRVL
jgi:hypothetical protein